MEQKFVGFCPTLNFSFTNFVGLDWIGLDSHVKLSDQIQSLEKHSPLISDKNKIFHTLLHIYLFIFSSTDDWWISNPTVSGFFLLY